MLRADKVKWQECSAAVSIIFGFVKILLAGQATNKLAFAWLQGQLIQIERRTTLRIGRRPRGGCISVVS